MIKLISAPIRRIVRFPLFQLAIVIGVILWLQAADDKSFFGQLFTGLDKLADSTVQLVSTVFTIKSFTKAWLVSGFMIAFVLPRRFANSVTCASHDQKRGRLRGAE